MLRVLVQEAILKHGYSYVLTYNLLCDRYPPEAIDKMWNTVQKEVNE